jgi:hypothetical protein
LIEKLISSPNERFKRRGVKKEKSFYRRGRGEDEEEKKLRMI